MIKIEELAKYINPDQNGLPTLYYEGDLRSPELQKEYEKADKIEFVKKIRELIGKEGYFISKNDFGYDLVDANHFVVWVEIGNFERINQILELVKAGFAGFEHIYFQHQSQKKSIKTLIHFHFLVKIL